MKRKIRIGLDFDGVVAYNPFRIIRAPIKWFKRKILGIKRLTFFVPKDEGSRLVWSIIHESSVFPATGVELLKEMARNPKYEFHLVTARFGFLKGNLYNWLEKNQLTKVFKSINVNDNQEQPHLYKQRILQELRLDIFVEDNLDIVDHLIHNSRTKIYWIYNFLDARHNYPYKYPYLKKVLEELVK